MNRMYLAILAFVLVAACDPARFSDQVVLRKSTARRSRSIMVGRVPSRMPYTVYLLHSDHGMECRVDEAEWESVPLRRNFLCDWREP